MRRCLPPLLAAMALAVAPPLAAQEAAAPMPEPGSTITLPAGTSALADVVACWVVDPESPAAQIAVTVEFALDRDARVTGDITLLVHSDGDALAVEGAIQAARRAILRCGAGGFALRPEDYETWKVVQMTLDPRELTQR